MSEEFIRHFVSAVGTLLAAVVFYAGYVAGEHGWLFALLGIVIVYPIVYGLIHAGH